MNTVTFEDRVAALEEHTWFPPSTADHLRRAEEYLAAGDKALWPDSRW